MPLIWTKVNEGETGFYDEQNSVSFKNMLPPHYKWSQWAQDSPPWWMFWLLPIGKTQWKLKLWTLTHCEINLLHKRVSLVNSVVICSSGRRSHTLSERTLLRLLSVNAPHNWRCSKCSLIVLRRLLSFSFTPFPRRHLAVKGFIWHLLAWHFYM